MFKFLPKFLFKDKLFLSLFQRVVTEAIVVFGFFTSTLYVLFSYLVLRSLEPNTYSLYFLPYITSLEHSPRSYSKHHMSQTFKKESEKNWSAHMHSTQFNLI